MNNYPSFDMLPQTFKAQVLSSMSREVLVFDIDVSLQVQLHELG